MKNRWLRTIVRLAILAVLYIAGGIKWYHHLHFFTIGEVMLLWAPFGIALAAVLLFGYRYWPVVAIGAIAFSFPEGLSGYFRAGPVLGATIGALICVYLLDRFVKFNNPLERVRDVAGFVGLACLLGTTVSAVFGAVSLCYAGGVPWDQLYSKTLELWVPNALGALVVTPVLLTWASPSFFQWKSTPRIVEACLCGVGLVFGTILSFQSWYAYSVANYPLAYLPYPFLVWGAIRFGQRGATTGTLLIAIVSINGLIHRQGPFVANTDRDSLMLLGSYIGIVAVTNMLLAAAATERSMAEENARKSEAMFLLISENVGDMIAVTDASGKRVYNSPHYNRWLGFPDDLTGSDAFEQVHPEDRARVKSAFYETVRTHTGKPLEFRFLLPDGTMRYIESLGTFVPGRRGQLDKVVTISRDITERKMSEEALQKSQQLWRAIFAAANDAILLLDDVYRVLACNETAEKMYGYPAGELVGKNLQDLRPPDGSALSSRMDEVLRTGGARWETTHCRKDGAVFPIEISSTPLNAAGITQYVQIIRDITERKQVEADLARARDEALVAARHKAEFLANMSHEIRTPMNGLIGLTDLLRRTELSPKQRTFADGIASSAQTLLALVNDILDFSKIEAGKVKLEAIDFNLHDAIEDSVELLATPAHKKGIELITALRSDVPAKVRGDPYRVRQILTNLLGNAVKFTERGEIVVTVSLEEETAADLVLRIQVRDTGMGISKATQAQLFQSFSQGDASITRRHGGTGLGLAISKQLTLLMNGAIGVESEEGRGSTFWFTIRLERIPDARPRGAPAELAGARVLIVEPNASARELMSEWASGCRMNVEWAPDAPRALEALHRAAEAGAPFSIAVLESELPDFDGVDLAKQIKSRPGMARTRLVLLHALAKDVSGDALQAADIAGTLSKPVRRSRFIERLAAIMSDDTAVRERAKTRQPAKTEEKKKFRRQPRILLVEDNLINQTVALSQLDQLGCPADLASNGREALAALDRSSYDVIFMDCQMPELDGYEATRRIRVREKQRSSEGQPFTPLHVIAMTAHAMQGDREKCLECGMNDYISKPVDDVQMEAALKRWEESIAGATSNPTIIPASAPASQECLVDLNRLSRVTGGDSKRMRSLVELYLQQSEILIVSLETAVQAGSLADVMGMAHKLAGSSSTCGMNAVAKPLRELEELARGGKSAGAAELARDARERFAATKDFLLAHLAAST